MINIEIEISKEILDYKLKNADYIKKLIFIIFISNLFIYYIMEILNFANLSYFIQGDIFPIIFRVNIFKFIFFN